MEPHLPHHVEKLIFSRIAHMYERLRDASVFDGSANESEKRRINALIAETAVRAFGARSVYALVLDSSRLHSSRELIAACVSPRRIIIAEINPRTHARQLRAASRLCIPAHHLYNEPLDCVIDARARKRSRINCAFFDFMGTIIGSKTDQHYPLYTIYKFLNTHTPIRIVFGVTFMTRMTGKSRRGVHVHNYIDKLLKPVFKRAGYRITCTHYAGIYGGGMWNAVFTLTRDPYIVRSEVRLPACATKKAHGAARHVR